MSWVARIKDAPVPQASSSSLLSNLPDSIPSVRSLSKYALSALGASQNILNTDSNNDNNNNNDKMALSNLNPFTTCPSPELSCHATTPSPNTCCYNTPGGSLLQTQFWDTNPPTGPSDSWTLHGLWPDNCDGTYDANCDHRRAYTNITSILQETLPETLDYMRSYWKDYKGDDNQFWAHEWSKHGTCVSTLEPACYGPSYQPTQEVPVFFNRTVSLFQSLPSYDFLAQAGIVPSTSKSYSAAEIQSALGAHHEGHEVYLGCSGGALNEIWYFFNVRGTLQDGSFEASAPLARSKCPSRGIRYLPKRSGGEAPTATHTSGQPAPTATGGPSKPFSGKGHLDVSVSGASKGCLISNGKWYVSGTCATYTAEEAGGNAPRSEESNQANSEPKPFTLSSSKGPCGLSASGSFSCGPKVVSSVFTAGASDSGKLVYGGRANFTAEGIPHGTKQVEVFAGDGNGEGKVVLEVGWRGA